MTHFRTNPHELWTGSQAVVIGVLFLLFVVPTQVVINALAMLQEFFGADESRQMLLWSFGRIINAVAAICALLVVTGWNTPHLISTLDLTRVDGKWLWLALSIGVAFLPLQLLLAWLANAFPVLDFAVYRPDFAVSVMLLCAIVSLWQELFFRGFVYQFLRGRFGRNTAILLSALLFAAFHLAPLNAIGAFVLGLVTAWLYERSGSLWPAIVVNALFQAFQLFLV